MNNFSNPNATNYAELHKAKNDGTLAQIRDTLRSKEMIYIYNNSSMAETFRYMCQNIDVVIQREQNFVYFIDYIYVLDKVRGHCFGNLTPNYRVLLEVGVHNLKYEEISSKFTEDYNLILDGIEVLIKRIIENIDKKDCSNKKKIKEWFERMLEQPA